ncbi:hypothetical protein [Arthrobacter rhombi]|uniref:hypothetical protein n=1 Tax=Arthrobacter rhombi TaxID=71253 RepID=UPI003FCF8308
MATPEKKSLSDKMKARANPPATPAPSSVASSFRASVEEYPKRLTLDLTLAQHRKLKMLAMNQDTSMNQILRDYIDNLSVTQ